MLWLAFLVVAIRTNEKQIQARDLRASLLFVKKFFKMASIQCNSNYASLEQDRRRVLGRDTFGARRRNGGVLVIVV